MVLEDLEVPEHRGKAVALGALGIWCQSPLGLVPSGVSSCSLCDLNSTPALWWQKWKRCWGRRSCVSSHGDKLDTLQHQASVTLGPGEG